MDLIEEEVVAFDDYLGEDQDFDQIDDLQVQTVSEPEESWGDEEPSQDSEDYSLISHEEFRCGWIDTSLPVMKKSDSSDSDWEVVSVGSVISLSDCSVNSIAHEILEREQDLSGFSEPVIDMKATDVEPEVALTPGMEPAETVVKKKIVKKKKKYKKNIKFGLILFRKNGLEIALCKKPTRSKTLKPIMVLPRSSMKKDESPLDAAVRCFVEASGCTNFDRFAALPSLIQKDSDDGKKTYLFFPTVVNCRLQFLPGAKYEVEWLPTNIVTRHGKRSVIDENIHSVVDQAAALLEVNAHSIPTLVDPEVEELADMAHRDLLDYALSKNISITSSEVRSFLSRNEEDLHKMFESPTPEEMGAMVRKLIMQLPEEHKIKEEEALTANAKMDIPQGSLAPLRMLQTFVAAHTSANGRVKWSNVNDMLQQHLEVLVDPQVQKVLQTCGWSAEEQRFKKKRKQRQHIFNVAMGSLGFPTAIIETSV